MREPFPENLPTSTANFDQELLHKKEWSCNTVLPRNYDGLCFPRTLPKIAKLYLILQNGIVSVEFGAIRYKLCENCTFQQNVYTSKLGEIFFRRGTLWKDAGNLF